MIIDLEILAESDVRVRLVCSISPAAIECLLHVLVQLVPEGSERTGVDYELSRRAFVEVWVECMG